MLRGVKLFGRDEVVVRTEFALAGAVTTSKRRVLLADLYPTFIVGQDASGVNVSVAAVQPDFEPIRVAVLGNVVDEKEIPCLSHVPPCSS